MKKNNQKTLFSAPGGKSYLVPFILITSLFLLWGFAHGLLDVLNKHFQGVFTMTKAESGLVQFSTYIAYFLMALPAGMFMKRFGYKKGIILGLCLFAVGAFAFIPAAYLHSASPFLIALFVIACGLCILETAANPYSTILGPEESGAQRLNLSQSFNGLGWILGPLVGGMLGCFTGSHSFHLYQTTRSTGGRRYGCGRKRICTRIRYCLHVETSAVCPGYYCTVLLLCCPDGNFQFLH